jgi:tripartite-type tricarboxylate transporter receptor subunit TctC
LPRIAIAENDPARPVRIIAGFAAGGGGADETGKRAKVVRSAGIKPD